MNDVHQLVEAYKCILQHYTPSKILHEESPAPTTEYQQRKDLVKDVLNEIENRLIILDRYLPQYAFYLRGLKTTVTFEVPTAAVDMYGGLYFNPEFWKQLKPEEATFILLHEALHVIRKDLLRSGVSHPTKGCWNRLLNNLAADYKINHSLVKEFKNATYTTGGVMSRQLPLVSKFTDGLYPDDDGVLRTASIVTRQAPFRIILKEPIDVERVSTEELMSMLQREIVAMDGTGDIFAKAHKLECGTWPEGYTPPKEKQPDAPFKVGDKVRHNTTGAKGIVRKVHEQTGRLDVDWDPVVTTESVSFKEYYRLTEARVPFADVSKDTDSGDQSSGGSNEPGTSSGKSGESSDSPISSSSQPGGSNGGSGDSEAASDIADQLKKALDNQDTGEAIRKALRDAIQKAGGSSTSQSSFDSHIYKPGPKGNTDSPSGSIGQGLSPDDIPDEDTLRDIIDHHTKAANRQAGSGEGRIGGALSDLEPELGIDWKDLLDEVVGTLTSDAEETYTARHVYFPKGELPGERRSSAKKKQVVVAIDMSGSVNSYRQTFLSASIDIFNQVTDRIDFGILLWDGSAFKKHEWIGEYVEPLTSVFTDSEYIVALDEDSVADIRNARSAGGGGTDMFAVARALNKESDIVQPDAVVIVTDGIYSYHKPIPINYDTRIVGIITSNGDIKQAEQSGYFDDIGVIHVDSNR